MTSLQEKIDIAFEYPPEARKELIDKAVQETIDDLLARSKACKQISISSDESVEDRWIARIRADTLAEVAMLIGEKK